MTLGFCLRIAPLAALIGCSGGTPAIVKADGSFVTVGRPQHASRSAAKEVADAYCQEHGKHAVLLSDACQQPSCSERAMTFWCR